MKPLFITVEGLDGSGKSTQLRYASSWLEDRGFVHRVTQEPGGTPLGDAIRAVFLNLKDEWTTVDGTVEAAGQHVLCDRFTDSSLAYQGFGRGVSLETLHQVDELATGCRVPDRTLLFDLPAAAARDRGHSASRHSEPGGVDRLDAEDLVFYERVRAGYLELASAEPDRFVVIDASGSIEQTRDLLDAALIEIFGGG